MDRDVDRHSRRFGKFCIQWWIRHVPEIIRETKNNQKFSCRFLHTAHRFTFLYYVNLFPTKMLSLETAQFSVDAGSGIGFKPTAIGPKPIHDVSRTETNRPANAPCRKIHNLQADVKHTSLTYFRVWPRGKHSQTKNAQNRTAPNAENAQSDLEEKFAYYKIFRSLLQLL